MDVNIDWFLWRSLHGIAKYQQKFYPMVFMFVRTETTFAYAHLFTVCKDCCLEFFGGNLEVQYGSLLSQMRFARSVALFDAFSELWLEEKYLAESWDLWFCSASDAPGVVPNQNPIESHHRTIKATAVSHIRAVTAHNGSDITPQVPWGLKKILLVAVDLCADANHYPRHKNKSRKFINRIAEYFFNSDNVVREDNLHGLNVSVIRTKTYINSVNGVLKRNEHVENVRLRYLSLHVY
ncbi:LOW QUALITY PROTEIN: Hypothetical protein PHPALM_13226 [Phytophthora palmivora]|uniref:Uncharacterized protein n=1 Tax=Phytophthora palmivora TaxID=4796 RepID=A0A2P4XXS7_9STRA|nr:LOW QUALITY PROTEIN: Hypothetical protein PHPALM_13226 [Phytophthora palmivora]